MQKGVIAVVKEGDIISIDIPQKSINLRVDDQEIQTRLDNWVRPEPKITKGYMARYARMVSSADKGAVME